MPYGLRNKVYDAGTQEAALRTLAELAQEGSVSALVRTTAIKIVRNCVSRDDMCELEAIYHAVKFGDPEVAPLKRGYKYIADPRYADYFTAPEDTLKACLKGACGSDCDDATALIMALAASLGWRVGARAWGPPRGGGEMIHVYPVAAFPKRAPHSRSVGLDTTVDEAKVGWEPPKSPHVLTAWIE